MSMELYNVYQEKITWTREQESCLNYTGNRTLMVKGIAGAGKSLVIQALAKQLLAGYEADKKNKVAIFTFSNTLNSATKEFLKINGEQEDYITVTTLTSYISFVYHSIGAPKIRIYTEPLYSKLKKEAVQEALEIHKKQNGEHRFHNLDLQFWAEEFDWMKDMNVSVNDMDYYLTLPRKGRGGKVRMTSADRFTAFQIFTYYDDVMKKKEMGDWIDQSLYLIRNSSKIPDELKFDHILIDEAQDLSFAQMMAAMMLFRKDMIVAMDMNQRIFDKQWTPKMLGIETTTKKLTKSMRTTKQIDNLAESIRKKNDGLLDADDQAIRVIPEKEGPLPHLVHLEDAASEKKYVTEQVKAYLKQNSKISIGIIASKNIQMKTYASWMTDAGIPHEMIEKNSTFSMSKPGVKIVNVYNAKGLEFSRVIIPQFMEGNFPYYCQSDDEEEMQLFFAKCRNLVYVGMTRAQFSLVITYHGENGSRFIGEFEPQDYKAVGLPLVYDSGTGTGSRRKSENKEIKLPPTAPIYRGGEHGKSQKGFIDWHGNKQDQYEDILEFAKMKEKKETDNFGSQMKKQAEAKFFGVPELISMQRDEILKLLLKEKKSMDMLYELLVQHAPVLSKLQIDQGMTKQFYDDFLRYSIETLFQQSNIEEERVHQFVDVILNRIFKVKNLISMEEHRERIKTSAEYRLYLSRGFELKSGNVTLFWQWIRYLAELSAKKKEGTQFIRLYPQFMRHLSYYINQLIADADVGKRYMERYQVQMEVLQKSVSTEIDIAHVSENIRNPIFQIQAEEEKKRKEAEAAAAAMEERTAKIAAEEERKRCAAKEARRRMEKKFLRLMKCAKIIPGYYILDNEDESDMITAGRIYSDIKEKKITLERMTSIFPEESSSLVNQGILPVISAEDVKFKLQEQESLHYVEYASVYMQGAEEEAIEQRKGILFLTNQRICLEFGKSVVSIPYEYLKKAVIYDVMPELMEFASAEKYYFVRTADTKLAYQIVKMILSYWADLEEQGKMELMNMEQLPLDFLGKEDIEAYIFGIKSMMDKEMPKEFTLKVNEMIHSLEFLDAALKKYPSYKEQSYQFFSYYIPEAVKILYAYNEYEKAGLSEQETNPVYEKVLTAIQKLSVAAKQQVVEIYKKAIVDTKARAEALTEILGQDGYVDSIYKITI